MIPLARANSTSLPVVDPNPYPLFAQPPPHTHKKIIAVCFISSSNYCITDRQHLSTSPPPPVKNKNEKHDAARGDQAILLAASRLEHSTAFGSGPVGFTFYGSLAAFAVSLIASTTLLIRMLALINRAVDGLAEAARKTETAMEAFTEIRSSGMLRHGDIGCLTHVAAKRGMVRALSFLVRHGASPLSLDSVGQTPLDVARTENMEEACKYLETITSEMDRKADDTPLARDSVRPTRVTSPRTPRRSGGGERGAREGRGRDASAKRWGRLWRVAETAARWVSMGDRRVGRGKVGVEPSSSSTGLDEACPPELASTALLTPLVVRCPSPCRDKPTPPTDDLALASTPGPTFFPRIDSMLDPEDGGIAATVASDGGPTAELPLSQESRRPGGEGGVTTPGRGHSLRWVEPGVAPGEAVIVAHGGDGTPGGVDGAREKLGGIVNVPPEAPDNSLTLSQRFPGRTVEGDGERQGGGDRGGEGVIGVAGEGIGRTNGRGNTATSDTVDDPCAAVQEIRAATTAAATVTTAAASPALSAESSSARDSSSSAGELEKAFRSSAGKRSRKHSSEGGGDGRSSATSRDGKPSARRSRQLSAAFLRQRSSEDAPASSGGRRQTSATGLGATVTYSPTQSVLNITWALRRMRELDTPRERRAAFGVLQESSPFFIPDMYLLAFADMAALGEIPRRTADRFLGHASTRPVTCSELYARAAETGEDPVVVYVSHRWLEPDFKNPDDHSKARFYQVREIARAGR